jgi:hypothetical protein
VDESLDDSGGRGRVDPGVLVGVVETALAGALGVAAAAGRWEVVAQIAEELAARRRAAARDDPASKRATRSAK